MPRWIERFLVVGHGGTGRTTALRSWADEAERHIDGSVVWIRGSHDRAQHAALTDIEHAAALTIDDAHWLDDEVIEAVIAASQQIPVAVARAPWPDSLALQRLAESLTTHDPALALTVMSAAEVSELRDASDDDFSDDEFRRATGGSPALTRHCIEARWQGDITSIPATVIDAVVRLARQSGPDVVATLQLMSLGLDLESAAAAAGGPDGDVERRLRVSGLLDERDIVPIASHALRADLTLSDRRSLADLVSTGAVSADAQANLDRASDDPILVARSAFRLGDATAERLIDRLASDETTAALRFGIDMRSMRWESAANRTDDRSLTALAAAFHGDLAPGRFDDTDALTDRVIAMFTAQAAGDDRAAVAVGHEIVERAIATDFDLPTGWSPAALVALSAIACGDPRAAQHSLDAAISQNLSGDGEQRCHRLLRAFAAIAVNEFSEALDLVREGTDAKWPVRDRFLLAALDAAIARRSGDTTRLRSAWQHCEPLLVGQPVSWLLADALIEVLAAGARLGDSRRVTPAVDHLARQLEGAANGGPGSTVMHWVRLQLAIASNDWTEIARTAMQLGEQRPADARSRARATAGRAWNSVAEARTGVRTIDLSVVDDAVDQLVDVDDAWEASRLLGQAALDHADAATAKALLERARQLVTDPIETADELIAAGLSEREAEVARLVAEGRTYKEIGGQLFISAKTVEHHVARIRQRLGASTRAEMLATIRAMS